MSVPEKRGISIMKILVENGCYHLRNMGDVAMLQIGVERLFHLFPQAEIKVLTDAPALLKRYLPRALAQDAAGRHIWFRDGVLLGGLHRFLPNALNPVFYTFERFLKRHLPELVLWLVVKREKLRKRDATRVQDFIHSLTEADLLVVSGGGDLNDEFADYALTLLDVLYLARIKGVRVAMLGQGIGPMRNKQLIAAARRSLPSVESLFVRERLFAPELLARLEVPIDRVFVTGDDAIEMARRATPEELGTCIGVNIRMAPYSGIDQSRYQLVQKVLRKTLQTFATRLLPVPISFHETESDVVSIRDLLLGMKQGTDTDGGASLDSPAALIEQVSHCRLVVTASYHAAVFALSQGIPAVCLAKSAYYIHKFEGLADQFASGCTVLLLDDEHFEVELEIIITHLWNEANSLRPQLLAAAHKQADAANAAYSRLCHLSGDRRREMVAADAKGVREERRLARINSNRRKAGYQ